MIAAEHTTRGQSGADDANGDRSRLVTCIAVERSVISLILLALGIVLLAEQHADWGNAITHLAQHLGLNPSTNGFRRLTSSANKLTPSRLEFYGIIAILYGLLHACEATGLWLQKRWGEYLTVVATLLLFIPDVYELVKKPSPVKGGLFVLNVAVIIYLVIHLRHTSQKHRAKSDAGIGRVAGSV